MNKYGIEQAEVEDAIHMKAGKNHSMVVVKHTITGVLSACTLLFCLR
jgi:hypothetical protein